MLGIVSHLCINFLNTSFNIYFLTNYLIYLLSCLYIFSFIHFLLDFFSYIFYAIMCELIIYDVKYFLNRELIELINRNIAITTINCLVQSLPNKDKPCIKIALYNF